MPIPNLIDDVRAAQLKYPVAWRNSHTGNVATEDFIRLLARDVRLKYGPRWGLNGKRGDPNDISDDILAYSGEGTAIDRLTGGPMEIIDVIARAGAADASPQWGVAPGGVGDVGAFVGVFSVPGDVGTTPPLPKPCPDPTAHEPKPPKPYPGDAVWDAVSTQLLSDMQRGGQPTLNVGSGRWIARTIWRVVNEGMGLQASIAKSRIEWCEVLGIPVI